ncbi:MAG: CRISPR-associated endonuclease Cas3'', partial [Capsulimonadaceae bacterium]
MSNLYAHSAQPKRGTPPQPYEVHVSNVYRGARRRARKAVLFRATPGTDLTRAVCQAAVWHDLGKVEAQKQAILGSDSKKPLPGIRHEEAGTAHLVAREDIWAAAIVAAHHKGLFDGDEQRERATSKEKPPLLRDLDPPVFQQVDKWLVEWINAHRAAVGDDRLDAKSAPPDSVSLRISLSCLVDADHTDTAEHQNGKGIMPSVRRRWKQRLAALQAHADDKPNSTARDRRRRRFFEACRDVKTDERILSCSAPVGSGKTLAVMAHLLQVARERGLRHIIVVLPFTNIIRDAVREYRKALTLPGENPEDVVVELHHQADFASHEMRSYAALWRAPIIVTTAVGFFETLASSRPSRLRKLHELPGSAIFVDEAHAALPAHLLPLAWRWVVTLCEQWQLHVVLGSGTLFRFWEEPGFPLRTEDRRTVPELTPKAVLAELRKSELKRIQPRRLEQILTVDDLVS